MAAPCSIQAGAAPSVHQPLSTLGGLASPHPHPGPQGMRLSLPTPLEAMQQGAALQSLTCCCPHCAPPALLPAVVPAGGSPPLAVPAERAPTLRAPRVLTPSM